MFLKHFMCKVIMILRCIFFLYINKDYLNDDFYLIMIPPLFFFSIISYSVARKDIKEVDILNLPESELSAKPGKIRMNQCITS